MTRSRIILLSLIGALLLAGAVYAFVELSNVDVAPAEEVVPEQQESEQDEQQQNQENTGEDTQKDDEPADDSESADKKESRSAGSGENAVEPTVYTGYGHTQEMPLTDGQQTSTTCTTSANVECKITFTNQANGDVVEFDPKMTDAQGVALWEWTGGADVPSGKWAVVATVGSKTSNKEIIYVE